MRFDLAITISVPCNQALAVELFQQVELWLDCPSFWIKEVECFLRFLRNSAIKMSILFDLVAHDRSNMSLRLRLFQRKTRLYKGIQTCH